jgi:hypothetical protein
MIKMIIQVLILMGAAVVGGILYGLIMTQIDLYHSKKQAKEQKEYWKRYAEYRKKQMKARGRTKVK